jgi:phytoene synthase
MTNQQLLAGFREAKKITKKFARTFYLASLFLPKDKRYASYAVYAICRLSDEAVDDISCSNPQQRLRKLEQKIAAVYATGIMDTPLLSAFRHTVDTYKIPKEYFDTLIDGMRMDLEIKRYADFPDLYEYCYRVAGVVGQIMLKIFGCRDKTAETYAIKLGVAMQLTNILRDIKEDLQRARIYLPRNEMLALGVTEEQLASGINNEAFKNLMRLQVRRAREIYEECLPGIKLIENRRSRFVVLAMKEIYSGILEAIQKSDYDVFNRRCFVKKTDKLMIIFKIIREGKYL